MPDRKEFTIKQTFLNALMGDSLPPVGQEEVLGLRPPRRHTFMAASGAQPVAAAAAADAAAAGGTGALLVAVVLLAVERALV